MLQQIYRKIEYFKGHFLSILEYQRVKRILNLAIPAALNSLLDMLNIIIDLIMVGKISAYAIIAVGTGMQYMMLVYIFTSAFYVGTNALISRFIGSNDIKSANKTLFNSSLLALFCSIPIVLFLNWLNPNYYSWITDSIDAQKLGISYMQILLYSLPFMFLKIVFIASFSASGNTKTPFFIKLFGIFLNTFLNYSFIFGNFGFPRLEVDGAAIATLIVHIIEFFILLIILLNNKNGIKFCFFISFELIKKVIKIGLPTSFERALTFGAMLYLSKLISTYGHEALAGYQVGFRIEGLAFMPGIGFMVAAMVLSGQSIGAKKTDEGEKDILTTLLISASFMGLLGIFMIVFPEILASIFTDDKKVIESASLYLFIIGFSQIPLAILFVLDGALRGAGATKTTFLINATSLWFLRIVPCLAISNLRLPLSYIFLVFSVETLIRMLIFWYFFKKGTWKSIVI